MNRTAPITIALADDHKILVESLAQLLEVIGFAIVVKAFNGNQLINAIENLSQLPNVCVLDINMPGMNGLETLIALQKRWPQLPVLILSLGDNEHIVTRMLMEGACGYLKKDCNAESLKNAIESIHNNGVYYSDQVSKQLWRFIKQGKVKLPSLTPMEWRTIQLSCESPDMGWAEIAQEMNVTTDSIHGFRDSVFRKLGVHSRAGLIKLALTEGFLPFEQQINDGELFYKKNPSN